MESRLAVRHGEPALQVAALQLEDVALDQASTFHRKAAEAGTDDHAPGPAAHAHVPNLQATKDLCAGAERDGA